MTEMKKVERKKCTVPSDLQAAFYIKVCLHLVIAQIAVSNK